MGGRWGRRVSRCRNPTEGFFSSGETPSWLQSQGKEGMGMEVGNENAGFDHYGWGEQLAVRWGVRTLGGMERYSDRLISKCLHFKSEASPGYFIPRVDYFQTSLPTFSHTTKLLSAINEMKQIHFMHVLKFALGEQNHYPSRFTLFPLFQILSTGQNSK